MSYQVSNIPRGLKHELLNIPPTSAPAFGGIYTYDIKNTGVQLHDFTIAYNLSSVSGLTGSVTNYPNLNPAWFFHSKIELLVNGKTVDTLSLSEEQFINNQLYQVDETRLMTNYSAGLYSSLANRNTMCITNGQWYFCPLKCFVNQAHVPLLNASHEIQIKITMNTLANIVNQSTLTGTPVVTINSAMLYARVTRLTDEVVKNYMGQMLKFKPYYFSSRLIQTFSGLASGTTSSTLVLSAITGPISRLMFIMRYTNALTGNSQFSFLPITNFDIRDSGSNSVIGGVAIGSSYNLLIHGKQWYRSSYLTDAFSGVANSYVYTYSFSADPQSSHESAIHSNARVFSGNEQLVLTYGSLSSTAQVDIVAYRESMLQYSTNGVNVIGNATY